MSTISTSREERYLLSCLTAALYETPFPAPPDGLDWEEFLQRLVHHRLVGLFAALGRNGQARWPSTFLDQLRRERVKRLLYGQAYGAELAQVLSALSARGIPVIVLKGWALIQSLYGGDTSQRVYSDADLLVPAGCADAGEQVLLELGYRPAPDEPHPGYFKRYAANLAFSSPRELAPIKGHVQIELHWALIHVPYFSQQVDMDGFFARATPISIFDAAAMELSPTDMLIHLAAHQVLHHSSEDRLARDYELAIWIGKHREQIDWSVLASRAQDWRLGLAVQQALERLNLLWPGYLPGAALAEIRALRTGWIERQMFLMETIHIDLLRVIEIFLSLPYGHRLRYLLETVFPGPAFLRWRYGLAPWGIWPLLHIVRIGNAFGRIPALVSLRKHRD